MKDESDAELISAEDSDAELISAEESDAELISAEDSDAELISAEDSGRGSQYPSILEEENLNLNLPEPLPYDATIKDARQADVTIANDMLSLGYIGLTRATSIASIVKLGDFVMRTVKERRHLLNLQYGTNSESSKGKIYDPLD